MNLNALAWLCMSGVCLYAHLFWARYPCPSVHEAQIIEAFDMQVPTCRGERPRACCPAGLFGLPWIHWQPAWAP